MLAARLGLGLGLAVKTMWERERVDS